VTKTASETYKINTVYGAFEHFLNSLYLCPRVNVVERSSKNSLVLTRAIPNTIYSAKPGQSATALILDCRFKRLERSVYGRPLSDRWYR